LAEDSLLNMGPKLIVFNLSNQNNLYPIPPSLTSKTSSQINRGDYFFPLIFLKITDMFQISKSRRKDSGLQGMILSLLVVPKYS
jgi:hypothetical protein